MPLYIHPDSHLDHGLTPAHVAFLVERFQDREAFFVETVELPPELAPLSCGLYGPAVGDSPVVSGTVAVTRGARSYPSRCVALPMRATRTLTVIAGPYEGRPCVLFTSYGGPPAPREVDDPELPAEERARSAAFWAEHALALP